MVSDWGPSHKSSCSLYTNNTCPKLSSSSYPHKPTTVLRPLTQVRANHLAQLPKAESQEWAQMPLSLASSTPSTLFELVAALLASLSLPHACRHCLHQPPFLSPGLPVDSFWQKNFNLSPFLSLSLSTPLFSPPCSHQNGRQSKCDYHFPAQDSSVICKYSLE